MSAQSTQPHPHHAAHCGLSALAIGSVFLMISIPALLLTLLIYATEYHGWSDSDRRLACYAGYVVVGVIDLFSWAGVLIGIWGIIVARRTGEPRVLCIVGGLMSLLAVLAWIGCFAAWHAQSAVMIPHRHIY